ncbi:hypothetical protein [Mucisphaera sp.]|uniref:hypothetical protein n=1 Tax=Mucisphaera sp. TaxID=2913024 RepID=UPI003D0CC4A6
MPRLSGCMSAWLVSLAVTTSAQAAFTFTIDSDDFVTNQVYGDVLIYRVDIVIDEVLLPGRSYLNPTLQRVRYFLQGRVHSADDEPSTIEQELSGSEFYDIAGGINFAVKADAELEDGLQLSELASLDGNPEGALFFMNYNRLAGILYAPVFLLRGDGVGRFAGHGQEDRPGSVYRNDLVYNLEEITVVVPEPTTATLLALTSLTLVRRSS